ncbi:MAG: hypothetical protein ACO3QB_17495 [bacterium]
MSKFELIEYQFDPDDFSLQLEDEFMIARLSKEIESVDDPKILKEAALKLLQLAVHRQAVIRGLVGRVAKLEGDAITKVYDE